MITDGTRDPTLFTSSTAALRPPVTTLRRDPVPETRRSSDSVTRNGASSNVSDLRSRRPASADGSEARRDDADLSARCPRSGTDPGALAEPRASVVAVDRCRREAIAAALHGGRAEGSHLPCCERVFVQPGVRDHEDSGGDDRSLGRSGLRRGPRDPRFAYDCRSPSRRASDGTQTSEICREIAVRRAAHLPQRSLRVPDERRSGPPASPGGTRGRRELVFLAPALC